MDRELHSVLVLLMWNIFTNDAELATGNLVNGSAYQSSIYAQCTASKAFDGEKKFRDPKSSCTCSVTARFRSPRWWEMDLGSKHLIGSIVVTGRSDAPQQSQNLVAYISNDTMGPNIGTVVHSLERKTFGLTVQFNDTPRVAQYINIKKDIAKDVMTICEVEVFEATCPSGYFGDKCLRRCHCKNQCEVISGHCTECEPGWEPPICEECGLTKNGEGCKHDCHCANGEICDGVTCVCASQECEQGLKGSSYNSHKKDERMFDAFEVAGVAVRSVVGCLLLLGLVIASVLVYRRYKSALTKTDTTNVIPDIENVNTGRTYEGLFEMHLRNSDVHMYEAIQN